MAVSDVCPIIRSYPAALQVKAADELAAMAPDSVIAAMIADYGVMRAQLRAGGCSNG